MTHAVSTRTADVIAIEINTIKQQTQQVVLAASVEIGRRLNEAKAMLPHGEWGGWLETNVQYSQSTANNLMSIYKEYGEDPQALGNLSYTKAVALLGVPHEEREAFVQEHDVEHMSSRELQQTIKEKKALEAQLQEEQQRAQEQEEKLTLLETTKAELQTALAEALTNGDESEIERLRTELTDSQTELADLQTQISDLQTQLQEKPIDVPAVIEKVPDDIQAKLQELEQKAVAFDESEQQRAELTKRIEELEAQKGQIPPEVQNELDRLRNKVAKPPTQTEAKFRVQFDGLVRGFQDLLETFAIMRTEQPDDYAKYKSAIIGLTAKMTETLNA